MFSHSGATYGFGWFFCSLWNGHCVTMVSHPLSNLQLLCVLHAFSISGSSFCVFIVITIADLNPNPVHTWHSTPALAPGSAHSPFAVAPFQPQENAQILGAWRALINEMQHSPSYTISDELKDNLEKVWSLGLGVAMVWKC